MIYAAVGVQLLGRWGQSLESLCKALRSEIVKELVALHL